MPKTRHRLNARSNPALLSIVMPVYNEEAMIPLLKQRLTAFREQLPCACEIIFVNDGSSDETIERLLDWADVDERVKILGLARNFGHQIAATAGLDVAKGDAVVIMDADLQDPPEVILEMLREYRSGYDVVYGQRASRQGEGWFKRATAWGFYRFMRKFVHKDLPADAGDFRLLSRACLEALKSMRETHRFLRGMVAWVGFAQTAVPFERPARAAGQTKYPLRKMVKFAWTAAAAFSSLPLQTSMVIGIGVAGFGLLAAAYAVAAKCFGWYTIPGWTSQMLLLCLLGGAILVSNGILGEYVGRIFDEIKDRPLYVVSLRANMTDGEAKEDTARLPRPI